MKPRVLLRILATTLALAACGGGEGEPDGGSTSDASTHDAGQHPDGGNPQDAATPDAGPNHDAGPPASTLRIERWGDRLYGRVLGMSRIDRELWIGTTAVIDPSLGETSPIRSALARLSLDTGELRVFEDELPRVTSDFGIAGPTPSAGVVASGTRRLAASLAGLLVIDGDTVTLHPLTVDGTTASPTHLAVNESSGAIWAATNLGLAALDPSTLAVRTSVGVDALGGQPGSIAVDPATGAVYAAVHPASGPSLVARVEGGSVTQLQPGTDGVPSGVAGDVVWSSTYGAAFIALASWDPRNGGVIAWDGSTVRTIASEGDLSIASYGTAKPFGAGTLGYDESAGVLVVGGRIHAVGPIGILEGGGLAWIDVSSPDAALGIVGVSGETSDLRGDIVTAAAYDPVDRRTYVALEYPCDEVHRANAGIHSIFFDGRQPRFELPILSSVRDMQRVEGELWIGVRDDNPGMACDGVEVQVGFARVDGSRGALFPEVRGWAATRSNATAIDFRGIDRRVVAGWRTELYAGSASSGILLSPALEIGTSLWPEDVAWQDDNTFWVAGHATHSSGDPPQVADVGPRGAARVVLNDAGAVDSITLYVRRARDPIAGVIEGLPSAEVYDVLFGADGLTYLVCGTERLTVTYDRTPRDEFRLDGQLRRGGIARIEADGSITIVAGPADVPDGRAAVFGPDGMLWVLDAERGLVHQTASGFEVVALPGVPAGSEPQALWVGEGTDLVAGYSTGAFVRLGDQTRFIDDVGFVWSIEASDEVLLLGTDRGLVRVVPEGVVDTGEAAPAAGSAPPFVVVEPPPPPPDAGMPDAGMSMDGGVSDDAGACIPSGSPCNSDPTGCCPGLTCMSFGFSRTCG